MSRELPPGAAAAFAAPVVHPVIFTELDWPAGIVRVWTGYGDYVWAGNTFHGTGTLGRMSAIAESGDLRANGVALSLSGIPSGDIVNALGNEYQGRPARIWLVAMKNDGTLEADPYQIFEGIIDTCALEDSGSTSTITVNIEKELVDKRTHNWRYTHEDQQIDYPGDTFFKYVAGLQTKEMTWGSLSGVATKTNWNGQGNPPSFWPS